MVRGEGVIGGSEAWRECTAREHWAEGSFRELTIRTENAGPQTAFLGAALETHSLCKVASPCELATNGEKK